MTFVAKPLLKREKKLDYIHDCTFKKIIKILMKKFKVGVIGNGFVGEAISFAFSSVSDMYVYDINPLKSLDDLESVYDCDFCIYLRANSDVPGWISRFIIR